VYILKQLLLLYISSGCIQWDRNGICFLATPAENIPRASLPASARLNFVENQNCGARFVNESVLLKNR